MIKSRKLFQALNIDGSAASRWCSADRGLSALIIKGALAGPVGFPEDISRARQKLFRFLR
jgi:hypothetical protein